VAFRFRAAAALDIRRKEEDAARIALAQAERAVAEADMRLQHARERMDQDGQRFVQEQRVGTEAWRVQSHQAWIERQRRELLVRAQERANKAGEAAAAAQAAREALKRRRVLEKLRDRAWRKHERLAHERHVKEMNELATLRFVAQLAEEGGTRAD